jgi:hypothetical protein
MLEWSITPLVAVISPLRTTLVPNTAAPFELSRHQQRVDDQSSVDGHVDAWNSQFSLRVHFDLYHGRYVSHEAAMHGDTPAGSVA